ncbi:tetratricopeptide repeat protein [Pseudogracilibacillus auburnensis]|uniref:tetratricopeptide repeat protein n=1 Tax=Pseudogracilibacillus auburnensis TaxID=1494959 RepID=UPI001A97221D|nr:hypothetical protein [Pseudogracilibacillus auburnensis]MBO1005897.1 hypothetical protein [Pseudogracilibacillus auburnensis]
MTNFQINPRLIEMLGTSTVPESGQSEVQSLTISILPGKYVRSVYRNKKEITQIFKENHHMLTCASCGRKGKYDLGLLMVNVDRNKDKEDGEPLHDLQMTGYFRCKHCNDAGNWILPDSVKMMALDGIIPFGAGLGDGNVEVGQNLLSDGSWHQYASDAEEHYFRLIEGNPDDSFLWNRLGNLYLSGNRPELAMSAYEHSLTIDPGQVESHFKLGDVLMDIKDWSNAGKHFHQVLIQAQSYKFLSAEDLREMLAVALQNLYIIHEMTSGEIPFLPSLDDMKKVGKLLEQGTQGTVDMELEIFPDRHDSFFPFAEMYMGERAKEIPLKNRTFSVPKVYHSPSKKKKQRKKRRKKK